MLNFALVFFKVLNFCQQIPKFYRTSVFGEINSNGARKFKFSHHVNNMLYFILK